MEICPHDKRVSLEIRFDDDEKVSLARCCFLHAFSHLTLEEYDKIEDIIDYAENQKINYAKSSNICIAKCFLDKKIKQVDVGISHACNLRCFNCFFKEHKDTPAMKKAYFDTLYKIKGHQLDTIMMNNGGEVFVYYDETVKYLKSLTVDDTRQVTFVTNLLLLNEERFKELKKISEETGVNYFFLPSVDGINKESYEAIRIGGTFEKITENLKLFSEIFGPENAVILYTIKKPNINETAKVEKYFMDSFGIRTSISFDVYDKECEAKYTSIFRKEEKIESKSSEEFKFIESDVHEKQGREPILTVVTKKPLTKTELKKYTELDFIEVFSFCGKKLKNGPKNVKYFKKVNNIYEATAFKVRTKYVLFLDDISSLSVDSQKVLYYFLKKTNAEYLRLKINTTKIVSDLLDIPIINTDLFRKLKNKVIYRTDCLYNNLYLMSTCFLTSKYTCIEIPENVSKISIPYKKIVKRIIGKNGILSN